MPQPGNTTARMPTKVEYEAPSIRFVIQHKVVQERNLSDLFRVFEVNPSELFSEFDEQYTGRLFVVLDFRDSIWIVPNATPLHFVYRNWQDHLIQTRGLFYAYLEDLPAQWRKSTILGLHYGSRPRAAVLPGNKLPVWKVEGPIVATRGTEGAFQIQGSANALRPEPSYPA